MRYLNLDREEREEREHGFMRYLNLDREEREHLHHDHKQHQDS
jgi:hypothetical protein